jgi:MmyB-like transcription regulator ligand binding domain
MLLMLANVLDVPLRERNALLLAAGFAPICGETGLDDRRMSNVRSAVEIVLKTTSRSAYAHDRHWNIVMANSAFIKFLTIILGHAPHGLEPLKVARAPRLNVFRLVFDPGSVRKVIVNWETPAKSMLNEAWRRLAWARDEALKNLINEILNYPGVPSALARTRPRARARFDSGDGIESGGHQLPDVQHRHHPRHIQRCNSASPSYRGVLSGRPPNRGAPVIPIVGSESRIDQP